MIQKRTIQLEHTKERKQNNKRTQYKKKKLEAPIWKGERVGSLRITSDQLETLNGEPLTYSLYSANDVRRGNFWQRLLH